MARLFPAARALEQVEGDAAVLRFLDEQGFPAERCACPEPTSVHSGQGVLLTELVPGDVLTDGSSAAFRRLGELLGRLHALPEGSGAVAREAGALHVHCVQEGGLRNGLDTALGWLREAEHRITPEQESSYESTLERMRSFDLGGTCRRR